MRGGRGGGGRLARLHARIARTHARPGCHATRLPTRTCSPSHSGQPSSVYSTSCTAGPAAAASPPPAVAHRRRVRCCTRQHALLATLLLRPLAAPAAMRGCKAAFMKEVGLHHRTMPATTCALADAVQSTNYTTTTIVSPARPPSCRPPPLAAPPTASACPACWGTWQRAGRHAGGDPSAGAEVACAGCWRTHLTSGAKGSARLKPCSAPPPPAAPPSARPSGQATTSAAVTGCLPGC